MGMAFYGRRLMRGGIVSTVVLLVMLQGTATAQSGSIRAIALTNVSDAPLGPGIAPGVVFESFEADGHVFANPVTSERGDLVFIATITGPGIDNNNDTGIWVYRDGVVSALAREGARAPGTPPGVVFSQFGMSASQSTVSRPLNASISASGRVVFRATLRGPGINFLDGGGGLNDDGLWIESDDGLELIIWEGETELPGYPGVLISNATSPPPSSAELWWGTPINMTADAHVVLRTRVNDNTGLNDWDVIVDTLTGTLRTFYRGGDPVPGYPGAQFWTTGWPRLTREGVLFHTAGNTEAPIVGFSSALWSTRNLTHEPIFAEGETLPGGFLLGLGPTPLSVNASARVVFATGLNDSGLDWGIHTEGIFGVPVRIASTGDPAPGTGGAAYGLQGLSTPVLCDNGTTIFHGFLFPDSQVNETNDAGIWSNRSGMTVELELREGDAAPDAGSATFTGIRCFYANATGQVAVLADLSDNTHGLWLRGEDGQYHLQLKTFDFAHQIDVFGDGSDLRVPTDIIVSPEAASGFRPAAQATGDGRRMPFNDDGDYVARLKFLDGSEGIFATVPCGGGDTDCSGVIDLVDYASLLPCLAGPGVAVTPECHSADFDGDGDSDLADFAVLYNRFDTPQ